MCIDLHWNTAFRIITRFLQTPRQYSAWSLFGDLSRLLFEYCWDWRCLYRSMWMVVGKCPRGMRTSPYCSIAIDIKRDSAFAPTQQKQVYYLDTVTPRVHHWVDKQNIVWSIICLMIDTSGIITIDTHFIMTRKYHRYRLIGWINFNIFIIDCYSEHIRKI